MRNLKSSLDKTFERA
jgi:hypothetical protein